MKFSARNRTVLFRLIFLGILAGTLAWELCERLLSYAGVLIDLGVGPVGIDLHVIAVSLYLNPGTLAGIAGALILFRRL